MKKIIFALTILLTSFSYSQNNFKDLKESKIKATGSFQFIESYYYDYVANSNNVKDSLYTKIDQSNNAEGSLTLKLNNLLEVNKEMVLNKISLFSKINIEYNQNTFCFIKFKTIENNIISKAQIYVCKKENNTWKEYLETNKIIEKIKLVLLLKENAFLQFEIKENNPKYPEINNLKSQVTDSDGILNIYKLANVIEKNKSTLSKYLDN
ncbi:hypothetical protein [Flavobacterium ginsengiterrae]|uniref:DUF4468 domain-containing protein n=1 Tax=Flavobacterium ginsengiterrae TaxID=871695 RepID=A0ABP7GP92_9FLAO